jgi:outer membrane protein
MNKRFKRLALVAAGIACAAFAGAQKIAHLNYDSLISLMPETKIATEAAQNYLKGLEQEMAAMQGEFETKYKTYLEQEPTMSDLLKKNKQDDLQQLQSRIQEFQRQAEMDYKRKQSELTAPLMEKAKKGIEMVAKENGYRYVLDTSPQNSTVLYSEASDDILNAVKKKLDSMPPASIPGAGSQKDATKKDAPQQGTRTPPPPQGKGQKK